MVKTFTLICFREKAGNVSLESLVYGYYYVTANRTWRGLYFRLDNRCCCLSRLCVSVTIHLLAHKLSLIRVISRSFSINVKEPNGLLKANVLTHVLKEQVFFLQCTGLCVLHRSGPHTHPFSAFASVSCPLGRWTKTPSHRGANSSGQESAVHLHQKDKGHSFEDSNVKVTSEDRWF